MSWQFPELALARVQRQSFTPIAPDSGEATGLFAGNIGVIIGTDRQRNNYRLIAGMRGRFQFTDRDEGSGSRIFYRRRRCRIAVGPQARRKFAIFRVIDE